MHERRRVDATSRGRDRDVVRACHGDVITEGIFDAHRDARKRARTRARTQARTQARTHAPTHPPGPPMHTHAHTHPRTHAPKHASTHAPSHQHPHTHTSPPTPLLPPTPHPPTHRTHRSMGRRRRLRPAAPPGPRLPVPRLGLGVTAQVSRRPPRRFSFDARGPGPADGRGPQARCPFGPAERGCRARVREPGQTVRNLPQACPAQHTHIHMCAASGPLQACEKSAGAIGADRPRWDPFVKTGAPEDLAELRNYQKTTSARATDRAVDLIQT
jgi:hypothetical protein